MEGGFFTMIPLELPELREYEKKLNIKQKLSYGVDSDAMNIRIYYDFDEKVCHIGIPPSLLGNPDLCIPYLVFQLCLVKNSEIDPLLAIGILSSHYEHIRPEFQEQYRNDRAVWGNVCTFLCKVWAIDLRHAHWPDITQKDHEKYYAFLKDAVDESRSDLFHPLPHLFSLAQHMMEIKRYSLAPFDFSPVLSLLPEEVRAFIHGVAKICESLPTLVGKKEIDVPLFEQWVVRLIYCMGQTSLHPRIIKEDDILKWTLGAPYSSS